MILPADNTQKHEHRHTRKRKKKKRNQKQSQTFREGPEPVLAAVGGSNCKKLKLFSS